MSYTLPQWGVMLIITSFIGFMIENTWLWLTKSYIDNRNMNLPFLFGYGFAVALVYLFVGTPSDREGILKQAIASFSSSNIMYFLFSFFFVSIGEIALGYAFRAACRFDYWDYSDLPFHVTKYTSFFTSILFAGAIFMFMNFCFSPIMDFAGLQSRPSGNIAVYLTDILIISDFIYCFAQMMKEKKPYRKWRKNKKNKEKSIQKKIQLLRIK